MDDRLIDPAELLATAEAAARLGGARLTEWRARFTVQEKSRSNLVTEADFASQEAIVGEIRSRFPCHSLLGEEGLEQTTGSRYRWIIDPLDGTSNYVHGFPYYAVTIGVECAGELIAGVVYDPTRQEMFSAIAGAGATCNGERLSVSSAQRLSESLVIASLPVATTGTEPAIQRFLRVLTVAQSLQRTGSSALNLAMVAAGRVDAFWSTTLKPWDMAGGVVLVREAGGVVTGMTGGAFDVNQPEIVAAASSSLVTELCPHLQVESQAQSTESD